MHVFLGFRCHTQGAHTAVVGVIEFGELVLLTGTLKLLTGVEQTLELNLGHDSIGGEQIFRSFGPDGLLAIPLGSNARYYFINSKKQTDVGDR